MVKINCVDYNEQKRGLNCLKEKPPLTTSVELPVPSGINPQDERLLALHVTHDEVLSSLRSGELDVNASSRLIKDVEGVIRQALTAVRGYYSARIKWGFYPEFVIRIGNKRIQVGSRRAEPILAQILGSNHAVVLFQLIELRRDLIRRRYIAWRSAQEQKRRAAERNAEVMMLLYNLGKYAVKLLKGKREGEKY